MAIFPGAISTDSDLYVAVNNLSTLLTDNPLTIGATTVNVSDTTDFPAVGFISIDAEIIKYTGKTATSFTGCTRGADGTTAASHLVNAQVDHNVIAAHHNAPKDEIIAIETHLGINGANIVHIAGTETVTGSKTFNVLILGGDANANGFKLTGLAAGTTNGDSLRYEQVVGVYAIDSSVVHLAGTESITGQKTFSSPLLGPDGTTALPAYSFSNDPDSGIYRIGANILGITTGNTLVASFASTGVGLKGTTTNDSAAVGFIGESVESTVSNIAAPTSTQWGDLTSISLTAGDWNVSLTSLWDGNGATWTGGSIGVSTTAGNSTTGLVLGSTRTAFEFASSSTAIITVSPNISQVRFSLSATTTIYFKFMASYSAGGPRAYGRISARRVR